ncbi:MAG TPA: YciI family protein [Arthrobacter sp.]|nr:YciI family protein [Arthrobacter sp.]
MARYLISFNDGDMRFPREDLPAVAAASHAVVRQAQEAGVWIFGGGVDSHDVSIVGTDGSVDDTQVTRHIGGFSIIEVDSHAEALEWAAKIAASCRCAQEVREIMDDPEA